jgi:hypothetical protein
MHTSQQVARKLIRGIKREEQYSKRITNYFNCSTVYLGKVLITQYYLDNPGLDSQQPISFGNLVSQLRLKFPYFTVQEITFLVHSVPSKYINQVYSNSMSDSDFPAVDLFELTDYGVIMDLYKPFLTEAKALLNSLID